MRTDYVLSGHGFLYRVFWWDWRQFVFSSLFLKAQKSSLIRLNANLMKSSKWISALIKPNKLSQIIYSWQCSQVDVWSAWNTFGGNVFSPPATAWHLPLNHLDIRVSLDHSQYNAPNWGTPLIANSNYLLPLNN